MTGFIILALEACSSWCLPAFPPGPEGGLFAGTRWRDVVVLGRRSKPEGFLPTASTVGTRAAMTGDPE